MAKGGNMCFVNQLFALALLMVISVAEINGEIFEIRIFINSNWRHSFSNL